MARALNLNKLQRECLNLRLDTQDGSILNSDRLGQSCIEETNGMQRSKIEESNTPASLGPDPDPPIGSQPTLRLLAYCV